MIAHIVLNVKDFLESEAFYDLLLFRLGYSENFKEKIESYSSKSYQKVEHSLWIKCEHSAPHEPFTRDIGLDHIAFKTESKSAVDDIYELVSKAGVAITRVPASYPQYGSDYYAFYFRDPNGIPLEIAYF